MLLTHLSRLAGTVSYVILRRPSLGLGKFVSPISGACGKSVVPSFIKIRYRCMRRKKVTASFRKEGSVSMGSVRSVKKKGQLPAHLSKLTIDNATECSYFLKFFDDYHH